MVSFGKAARALAFGIVAAVLVTLCTAALVKAAGSSTTDRYRRISGDGAVRLVVRHCRGEDAWGVVRVVDYVGDGAPGFGGDRVVLACGRH
jgi:hypothetical protein